MTRLLLHGGSLTWDELILVILAYVLLGFVLLTGRSPRDQLVRKTMQEQRPTASPGAGVPVALLDVSHRYAQSWALQRVDLTFEPGSVVGIIGSNGAGKSTLLKILATVEAPTAGDVVVGGTSLRADPAAVRSDVGVVFHEPLLYPRLTVTENLTFFATLFDLEPAKAKGSIANALELVSMWDQWMVRVDRLSHGQKQRVAFARALLHEPRLLLLDEPYAGLDLIAAERLDMLLLDLKAAGHTIVLTSHDFARCYELADRLVMLRAGTVAHDVDCTKSSKTQAELLYRSVLES